MKFQSVKEESESLMKAFPLLPEDSWNLLGRTVETIKKLNLIKFWKKKILDSGGHTDLLPQSSILF